MNRRNADNVEAVAARSNLMATAGEFVPRAFRAPGVDNQPPNVESDGSQAFAGSTQYYRSNEYYSRNREPKYSRSTGGRPKRNEREVVGPPPQDGRLWRDGNRQGRKKDQWANNEFQAHSSGFEGPVEAKNNNQQRTNRQRKEENGPRPRRPNVQYEYQNGNGRNHSDDREKVVKPYKEMKNRQAFKSEEYRNHTEGGRNQMEVLIGQLTRGTLECLVCCDHVRQSDATWSCHVCHHVLHLRCVIKWARASRADEGNVTTLMVALK